MGVSFEEAETLKTSKDVDETIRGEGEDIIKKGCENMASEIQKTLDFFSSTAYESINQIYLSGGCAKTAFLKSIVEEKTDIPTEIIDCFRSIKYEFTFLGNCF